MYQIGYMAIAVGFVVGFAIRFAGKGIDKVFGVTGAILALFGCLTGNFFSQIAFGADYLEMSYTDVLSAVLSEPSLIKDIMVDSFSPMDVVFYGIAIFAGYRYSFHDINSTEN